MIGLGELLEIGEAPDAIVSGRREYFGMFGDISFADIALDPIGGKENILDI